MNSLYLEEFIYRFGGNLNMKINPLILFTAYLLAFSFTYSINLPTGLKKVFTLDVIKDKLYITFDIKSINRSTINLLYNVLTLNLSKISNPKMLKDSINLDRSFSFKLFSAIIVTAGVWFFSCIMANLFIRWRAVHVDLAGD